MVRRDYYLVRGEQVNWDFGTQMDLRHRKPAVYCFLVTRTRSNVDFGDIENIYIPLRFFYTPRPFAKTQMWDEFLESTGRRMVMAFGRLKSPAIVLKDGGLSSAK